ncbi:MAG: alternative ribosome rescue aminoacyl-tRNA hydrolase ArfB [Patescibacteria group bacterium]|nr:alternative ribosome rescue aminoacyl-tRNA hydrolase ArfB [Patescibacteria group bacterium]
MNFNKNPFDGFLSVSEQRENAQRLIPESEYRIDFARSSGPGGQKVNKTSSKAVLHWDVGASSVLTEEEKAIVRERLANRINKEGELVLDSDRLRSQFRNRTDVVDLLNRLVNEVLTPQAERIPTRPTRASKERRLDEKYRQAQKKRSRRNEE